MDLHTHHLSTQQRPAEPAPVQTVIRPACGLLVCGSGARIVCPCRSRGIRCLCLHTRRAPQPIQLPATAGTICTACNHPFLWWRQLAHCAVFAVFYPTFLCLSDFSSIDWCDRGPTIEGLDGVAAGTARQYASFWARQTDSSQLPPSDAQQPPVSAPPTGPPVSALTTSLEQRRQATSTAQREVLLECLCSLPAAERDLFEAWIVALAQQQAADGATSPKDLMCFELELAGTNDCPETNFSSRHRDTVVRVRLQFSR